MVSILDENDLIERESLSKTLERSETFEMASYKGFLDKPNIEKTLSDKFPKDNLDIISLKLWIDFTTEVDQSLLGNDLNFPLLNIWSIETIELAIWLAELTSLLLINEIFLNTFENFR